MLVNPSVRRRLGRYPERMPDVPCPHLILAGPTRAASTALFDWLAAHPSVCRASIKEARFFLRDDPCLNRLHRFEDGPTGYARFFTQAQPGQTCLEATPDYLYDPAAAARIAETLPEARVVLVLREPVSRLISWHRYARQQGMLPADLSLDHYVQQMRELGEDEAYPPQALRALAQGRYSRYLSAWLEAIPEAQRLVLNYHTVTADPLATMQRLCAWCGLEASVYDGFDFDRVNASGAPTRAGRQKLIRRAAWALKPLVHDKPMLRKPLRAVRRVLQPPTKAVPTTGTPADETLSSETQAFLEAYYRDEPARLGEMLGGEWF